MQCRGGYKRATPAIRHPVSPPELDDKWGRHRCRPHSHRCVAEFLQHECSRDTDLASDVSPSGHSKMVFRFLHRRSHRHPDLPSARPGFGRLRSEDRSPALPSRASTGGSAAWPSTGGRRLERSHRVPARRPLRGAIFGNRPGWPGPQRETFALPSSTRLASGQRPWHEGLEKRADRTRCVFPVSESSYLSDR